MLELIVIDYLLLISFFPFSIPCPYSSHSSAWFSKVICCQFLSIWVYSMEFFYSLFSMVHVVGQFPDVIIVYQSYLVYFIEVDSIVLFYTNNGIHFLFCLAINDIRVW